MIKNTQIDGYDLLNLLYYIRLIFLKKLYIVMVKDIIV